MPQKIHNQSLSNGLTLVAEEMPWLESAAFALLMPAGCVYEPADKLGLASLTCEMAQRGAGPRDSRQFLDDLENLGADSSASVSIAHTSVGGAMPAESLPQVLSIFADLVQRPHLPEDQLEDARLGCLQEVKAIEDDLAQKTMQQLRRSHYSEPWGRNTQGTEATVSSLTIADVRQHFEKLYSPRDAILSVAGKIDWPQLKADVERLFGGWTAAASSKLTETPPPRTYCHLPAESSQTHIGIALDAVPYSHPDYFQIRGAVGVLSDGMSSRLFTEVREKRGLVYTVYASLHSLRDRGSILAYAGTTAERAQETLDVMLTELKGLYNGITADEIDRLKGRIKRALIIQQESSPSRAGSIALDWYYLSRIRTMAELSQIIDDLSADSINAYLAAHRPQQFTVTTVGRDKLQVPA
ncbi:MAG TPA: pitrilysin family protein [Pirellulaceae bacterium]|nr:pitrilysin family protein [Pirellulaceae bacterium]